QAPALIERSVLAADQDDRDVAALLHLLELAADLEAILLGQDDVEHDTLGALLQDLLQRLVAVNGGDHIITPLAPLPCRQRQIGPAIIYNQDLRCGHDKDSL